MKKRLENAKLHKKPKMMIISGTKPQACFCWQRVSRRLITGGSYEYMKGKQKEIIFSVAQIQVRIEVFSIVNQNCAVKNNVTDQ